MNIMAKVALKRLLVDFFEGSHPILAEPAIKSLRGQSVAAAIMAIEASAPVPLVFATMLRDVAPLISAGRSPREVGHSAPWQVDAAPLSSEFHAVFGDDVLEPIRLQPEAERYLMAVDAHYRGALPAATVRAMSICDMPMIGDEILAFEQRPFFQDALNVYRWHAAVGLNEAVEAAALIALLNGLD